MAWVVLGIYVYITPFLIILDIGCATERVATAPGDVIIGGIFPIHEGVDTGNESFEPHPLRCVRWDDSTINDIKSQCLILICCFYVFIYFSYYLFINKLIICVFIFLATILWMQLLKVLKKWQTYYEQWLALLPHSKKILGFVFRIRSFLCGICMFFLCPHGLPLGTPSSSHSPETHKLFSVFVFFLYWSALW